MERQIQRLSALLAGGQASDFLLSALGIRAEFLERDPSVACMRRLWTELRADPPLAPQVAASMPSRSPSWRQVQAEGDIRADLPAERVARLIFAAIVGVDELSRRTTWMS